MLKFQDGLEEGYDLPKSISLSISRTNHFARIYVEDVKLPLIDEFSFSFPSFLPSILPFLSDLFSLLTPL